MKLNYKEIVKKYRTPRDIEINVNKSFFNNYLYVPISVRLSMLCIKLKIKPDTITYSWMFMGIIGVYLFSFANYGYSLLAILIFHIALLMDYIDGTVARYNNTASKKGKFLEDIAHLFAFIIFLTVGISIYVYIISNNVLFIFLGMIIIISNLMITIINEKVNGASTVTSSTRNKFEYFVNLFTLHRFLGLATILAVFNLLNWLLYIYSAGYLIMLSMFLFINFRKNESCFQ